MCLCVSRHLVHMQERETREPLGCLIFHFGSIKPEETLALRFSSPVNQQHWLFQKRNTHQKIIIPEQQAKEIFKWKCAIISEKKLAFSLQ